jgi:hypothetical protein
MTSLRLLSFPLPIEKGLHMSIPTTVITMKTITLSTSNRKGKQRRGQWDRSSRMSNQRGSSQDRRRLQEANIMKMNLLIMNLSKSIHQEDTWVMSKQVGTERLKLITKSSEEVISPMKFRSSILILA